MTRSDVPPPYNVHHDVFSHLHRAIERFGDDVDLVIEVRLRNPERDAG